MNFLANTQNIHELLEFDSPTRTLFIWFALSLFASIFAALIAVTLRLNIKIPIIFIILAIVFGGAMSTTYYFVAKEDNSKKDELNEIVFTSLKEKYDFEDIQLTKSFGPNQTRDFGMKVFKTDGFDAQTVDVILNDDQGIVTWRVVGDPDTAEVKFIGDGNISPEDILKEK